MASRHLLLLLLSTVVFVGSGLGQVVTKVDAVQYFDQTKRWYNTFTEHWFYFSGISEADIRDSIDHWERIGADLQSPSSVLPGTYATGGDTHGSYLRWSENSGFILMHVNKCQGGPTQIIRGSVVVTPQGVDLITEKSFGGSHGHGQTHKQAALRSLIDVRWSGIPYLIPDLQLSSFSDYVAGFGEFNGEFAFPLGSRFLSKMGAGGPVGETKFELPTFPRGYESFARSPARGKIAKIGRSIRRVSKESDFWDDLITTAWIDIGSDAGLTRDMTLFRVGADTNMTERVVVREVRKNTAVIEIIRDIVKRNCKPLQFEDCKNPKFDKLRPGIVLSSNGF